MSLSNILGKKVLFFDGGMGTMLQKYGMGGGEIPEYLNITNNELIESIHTEYLEAGADFITTNTFGVNELKMSDDEYSIEQIVSTAVDCAKKAICKYDDKNKKYIALDIGPCGKLLEPIGNVSFDTAYNSFARTIKAGVKCGVDCIIIETMSDTQEARAAVLAAKENSNLPVICTMTFDESGKTLTGADAKIAGTIMQGIGADCIGINCGLGPDIVYNIAKLMHENVTVPMIVQPNAGLPRVKNGKTVYDVSPQVFAEWMKKITDLGIAVVGGCCGTTPEYISLTKKLCMASTPSVKDSVENYVCSYCMGVEIGKRPVIIGERINPTGKKKFKEALKSSDFDYILGEAIKQEEAGADVLDVNVGLPEIDEKSTMCTAVSLISATVPLPLQIDSSEPDVIEAALRRYNGQALINSVNGKKEVLDAVLPIAAKYGGVVVGLTLDEKGIPETAEERVEIAKRIIDRAREYGVKRVVIDPLTLTISAQQKEAMETLRALEILSNMGIDTILGVSNISFGLPRRELVNSTFFAMALNNGLKACIINPCSESMMDTYRSFTALKGFDIGCEKYISKYTGTTINTVVTVNKQESNEIQSNDELYVTIVKGLTERAYDITIKLLETREPMDIINNTIIPALNYVGEKFEKGTMFLPQLLQSANTVKNAFDAIKKHILEKGEVTESKGKVVIATVRGDIHDIGKNIVRVLLENYGYEVIDLGKDVAIECVIETLKETEAKLLGLSALMTTTVASMEQTIKAVRTEGLDVKIFVGGAVLTEEYANMIGADKYTKDALASVAYCAEILGK